MNSFKIIFQLVLIFFSTNIFAQNFLGTANIQNSNQSGFAKILLLPEIKSSLNEDLSDIRIYDIDKNEIPYLKYTDKPEEFTKYFKEYKILTKDIVEKKYTRFVIHNSKKEITDNIILEIKNSDVRKRLVLNASDDNKNWYVLKENYYFYSLPTQNSTSEIRVLDLPSNNYEFYELIIYDYFEKPLNILKAGKYETSAEKGKYSETEKPEITEIKSSDSKISIFKILFKMEQYIDKIEFFLEYSTFFNRDCKLATLIDSKSNEMNFNEFQNFTLNSSSLNTIFLNQLKLKEFYLIIKNNDDKPLKLKNIKLFQLNTYLTANLEKDKKYTVKFKDFKIKEPIYDLKFFTDSIPNNIPNLKTENIVYQDQSISIKNKEENTKKNNFIMWIVIISVIILLGFFTFKIVNDMKKK